MVHDMCFIAPPGVLGATSITFISGRTYFGTGDTETVRRAKLGKQFLASIIHLMPHPLLIIKPEIMSFPNQEMYKVLVLPLLTKSVKKYVDPPPIS